MFYGKVLNRTLSDYVGQCLGQSPKEALKLHEELALMRHAAGQVVAMYSAALDTGKQDLITNAALLMRDWIQGVASLCEQAARVEFAGADKVSVHQIAWIVNQVCMLAYKSMDDEDARRFESVVRDSIRISAGPRGTDVTPDQVTEDVTEMDATIPHSNELKVIA